MRENEKSSENKEPMLSGASDDKSGVTDSVPTPATGSFYATLVQARAARRARWARRVVASILGAVALGLLWGFLANGVGFLHASSTLQGPSVSTPVSVALAGVTPSATAALSVPSATNNPTAPATSTVPSIAAPTADPIAAAPTPTVSGLAQATPLEATTTATPSAGLTPTETAVAANALPLSGRRIGLDPGHGPRGDLGVVLLNSTTSKLILSEAEFNLDVALRCRDLLVARGASVMLTRETADTFTAPWPVDANGDGIVGGSGDDLQTRIDILNSFHADAFLSIHANGGSETSSVGRDIQVVYCGTADCGFPVQSKQLGQFVLNQLTSKLADAGYTAQGSQLATDLDVDTSSPPQHMFLLGPINPPRHVRSALMPGVLAESLYVSSPQQAAELNKSSVRQAIALAYADALQAYLTGSK